MRTILLVAAALSATLLGGCVSYSSDGYYVYESLGGDEGRSSRDHRHSRTGGGRSEPGNESGMVPGRPGDGRGSGVDRGGGSRGGEAGR